MNQPYLLSNAIGTEDDLKAQYRDSRNLCARAAIYRFSVSGHSWLGWVFDQMLAEVPKRARILEVGCGPGALWKENLGRIPEEWRIVLSDVSAGMVEEARGAVGDDERIAVARMDVQRCGFGGGAFDAVVANHMLYHVSDLPRGLGEIQRVLRPGGKLLATTNGENHLVALKVLISEYMGDESPLAAGMPFSLENGEALLRRYFGGVERRVVRDELRIRQAEAVVDYVMSVNGARQRITGSRLAELRERIQRGIDEAGAFVAGTEAGIFVAHL